MKRKEKKENLFFRATYETVLLMASDGFYALPFLDILAPIFF